MTLICGIDEAGKGPVIGPLVLAGVLIDEGCSDKLKAIGVKDSKLLSPKRREELAIEIKKLAKAIKVIKVLPAEIDGHNQIGCSLNELEAMKCAEIIDCLNPITTYIDSPTSPNPATFGYAISKHMNQSTRSELVCSHRADQKWPVVSAASIIAKTERDAEIEKIKQQLGIDFGSGYPADEITKKFLKANFTKASLHPHIRKCWATYKALAGESSQTCLDKFR